MDDEEGDDLPVHIVNVLVSRDLKLADTKQDDIQVRKSREGKGESSKVLQHTRMHRGIPVLWRGAPHLS